MSVTGRKQRLFLLLFDHFLVDMSVALLRYGKGSTFYNSGAGGRARLLPTEYS